MITINRPDPVLDPVGYAMSYVNELGGDDAHKDGGQEMHKDGGQDGGQQGKDAQKTAEEAQKGAMQDALNKAHQQAQPDVYSVTPGLLSHINDLAAGNFNSGQIALSTKAPEGTTFVHII